MLVDLAETEGKLHKSMIKKTQISIAFQAMLFWSFTFHMILNIINQWYNTCVILNIFILYLWHL